MHNTVMNNRFKIVLQIGVFLERFQWKALRMTVDAPRYVIRRDLQTPTTKEEIRRYSSQYRGRLTAHTQKAY
jgi:hypothetical protein